MKLLELGRIVMVGLVLLRVGAGILVVLAAAFIAQERMFYQDRRPTRAGIRLNRWWARAYGIGLLPSWLVSLETVGRRTGEHRVNALVRADYQGGQYLVSMLGKDAEWMRNVRAQGGRATIHHGRRIRIMLEDVPIDERAPIIKAYLSRARGARRHVAVRHDAPIEAFRQVAEDCPVMRIQPDVAPAGPPVMPRDSESAINPATAAEAPGAR